MPNWCDNVLTVMGPADKVDALMQAVHGTVDDRDLDGVGLAVGPLSFNSILPIPEELAGTTAGSPKDENAAELKAKYGYENWYEWRIANWGTKWDVGHDAPDPEVYENRETKTAVYSFSTAWSPPLGVTAALAAQHPDVVIHLRFEEPGMDFAGSRAYKGEDELESIDLETCPSRIDFDEWRFEDYLEGTN